MQNLQDLKKLNGDGYLFSKNGGEKPLDRSTVYVNFHKALMNIGMAKEVQDSLLEPVQEEQQEETAGAGNDKMTQRLSIVSFENRKTA
jgi:hypothetical protein